MFWRLQKNIQGAAEGGVGVFLGSFEFYWQSQNVSYRRDRERREGDDKKRRKTF